jgi:glucokinase
VVNDARAAGLAEALVGAGRGASTVLSVTVGTGIGGALVADGSLIVGTGFAGEVGHMMMNPSGPPCTCGRNGCWERYVGGRALAARAEAIYPQHPEPLEQLLADATDSSSRAAIVIREAADTFMHGLDNLHAIFAPAIVVLGGGIMARNGLVAREYREAAERTRWGDRAVVRDSQLGDSAGIIGAALASSTTEPTNPASMDL